MNKTGLRYNVYDSVGYDSTDVDDIFDIYKYSMVKSIIKQCLD